MADGTSLKKASKSELFSWGANSYGQLCCGHKNDVSFPENVGASCHLKNSVVAAIDGGGGHTAIITGKGKLFMCGWNNKGQLGLGDTEDRQILCHVQGLSCVKTVSCGWNHTLAVTDAGLFVWGSNAFGQLGIEKLGGHMTTPAKSQYFTYEEVISTAAGLRHSLVALANGSVWSWGANKKGQLGIGKTGGNCSTPQQVLFSDGQQIIEVVAGAYHSAVLTTSGHVFCWGSNQHGQCGKPPDIHSTEHQIFIKPQLIGGLLTSVTVTQVHTGWSHLLAVTEDIKVFSWGRADYGQLGLGDDVVQLGFSSEPAEVVRVRGANQVLCGAEHNIALLDSGSVMTWGWNEHGICGSEDETRNVHQPSVVSKLHDYITSLIGCGGGHSFAVVKG
ncbi:secretion-regulating guanine nucleotide exchange factor isoform X1 [Pocillopora verrucosa]|uniref:secretion-regulating guanine nucleotide exchange factor isoform X1 n=2 Tax=Pocillopora verrucosa TaxID=203993 RepID=UPI00333F0FBA